MKTITIKRCNCEEGCKFTIVNGHIVEMVFQFAKKVLKMPAKGGKFEVIQLEKKINNCFTARENGDNISIRCNGRHIADACNTLFRRVTGIKLVDGIAYFKLRRIK